MCERASARNRSVVPASAVLVFVLAVALGLTVAASAPEPADAYSVDQPQPFEPEAPSQIHRLVVPGVVAKEGVESPPVPALTKLQAELEAAVAAHPEAGSASVAVTDLETGATAGVNSSRWQFSGCTANMFALVIALRDVHEGKYPLSTVDALIRRTIMYSDPVTARELYRLAGSGNVAAGVERAYREITALLPGTSFQIDHPPAFISENFNGGQSNILTAESLNRLMLALWNSELVAEPERSFLLSAMGDVSPGLSHLLGTLLVHDGVTVHHKNGFFYWNGWVDNDTGIVQLEREDGSNHAFAITFLSEGVQSEWGNVALAGEVAELAYQYFLDSP